MKIIEQKMPGVFLFLFLVSALHEIRLFLSVSRALKMAICRLLLSSYVKIHIMIWFSNLNHHCHRPHPENKRKIKTFVGIEGLLLVT